MMTKAPTLAWLLTALACLLIGMLVSESRHPAVAQPAAPLAALVITVQVAYRPTENPSPTPLPTLAPPVSPTPEGPGPTVRPGGKPTVH